MTFFGQIVESARELMNARAAAEEELAKARNDLADTELEIIELYELMAHENQAPSNVHRVEFGSEEATVNDLYKRV